MKHLINLRETGIDIPVHVDAASGGFLAPFVEPELKWDFRLPRVKSINSSGYKFGLSPLGVGWVVWADKKYLPQDLVFNVNYLGGDMPTFALNFSRPGGQIVVQYYNFVKLGFEGYKNSISLVMMLQNILLKKLRVWVSLILFMLAKVVFLR